MYKFFKNRSVHIMRNFLVLVLSLALGLSCALTMGCQKKPGEEQNKAAERAAEVKNTADEKAAEANAKAVEKAAEVNAKVAGWDSCKGCHTESGKPASSKVELLKRFKTEKELIAAAKASKNPMMNKFKKDDLLKAAAKDLGLK
jgi:hypothetical protein